MIRLEPLTGATLADAIDDVARLRIAVFRDWPYLYDGDLGYERDYLADFSRSDRAIIVAAFDGDQIIGAATGAPMQDHATEFATPFASTGLELARIFYCAESVLLPKYRGQGVGHGFFDHREAHARAMGFDCSAFCGVIRPADHPLRPTDYQPLDAFWRKRGYAPLDGVVAEFRWKDIDQLDETSKPLQFWMRSLSSEDRP